MTKMLEFLFGGMSPERRLPEAVSWTFPGLVFLAAFPKELVGMNYYQWLMTALALTVGSRAIAGFPMFGLKLEETKLSELREMTSVTIGVAGLGCCATSQDIFGWSWKVYVWTVIGMSVLTFIASAKASEDMRKQNSGAVPW